MGGGRRRLHVVTDLSAVVVDGVEVVLAWSQKFPNRKKQSFLFEKEITEEEEMRASEVI